jgi:hypothetical protein
MKSNCDDGGDPDAEMPTAASAKTPLEVVVTLIPVTSAIKLDLSAVMGPMYSNIMPSVTQAQIETRIVLSIPADWEPGAPLTANQQELARVIAYVSEPIDAANAQRLSHIVGLVAEEVRQITNPAPQSEDDL